MTTTITPATLAGRIAPRTITTPVSTTAMAAVALWPTGKASVTGFAWAAVAMDARGVVTATWDGETAVSGGTLALAAVGTLLRHHFDGSSTPVWVATSINGNGHVDRDALQHSLPETWTVTASAALGGHHHAALKACLEEKERLRAEAAAVRRARPLRVGTDASRAGRLRPAGLGVVTADGQVFSRTVDSKNIDDAEAHAMELALCRVWREHGQRLILESDSKVAVHALKRLIATDGAELDHGISKAAAQRLSRAYLYARSRGPISVRWVKGHAGHVLNEAADRLAHAERYAHEAGSDASVRKVTAEVAAHVLRIQHQQEHALAA